MLGGGGCLLKSLAAGALVEVVSRVISGVEMLVGGAMAADQKCALSSEAGRLQKARETSEFWKSLGMEPCQMSKK